MAGKLQTAAPMREALKGSRCVWPALALCLTAACASTHSGDDSSRSAALPPSISRPDDVTNNPLAGGGAHVRAFLDSPELSHPADKALFSFLTRHIEFLPHSDFERFMFEAWDAFEADVPSTDTLIFLKRVRFRSNADCPMPVRQSKSNDWLLDMLREREGSADRYRYVLDIEHERQWSSEALPVREERSHGDVLVNSTWVIEKFGPALSGVRFVVFDDGSFTGSQITNVYFRTLVYALSRIYPETVSQIRFDLVVPFRTRYAEAQVAAFGRNDPPPKLDPSKVQWASLARGRYVPMVSEMLADEPGHERTFDELYGPRAYDQRRLTLFGFAHRWPSTQLKVPWDVGRTVFEAILGRPTTRTYEGLYDEQE